ncbi:MAG: transporter substrate-binding domain-containing protein [Smithella sp.]|jgi:polar amino acid transport system substrate-binding protein
MKKSQFKIMMVLLLLLCFVSSASAGPTIDKILKKKELVVGTTANLPPMAFKAKDGKLKGLDIDLSRLIASSMHVKLRLVEMPFDKLIPALESGKIDMILSCMTITPERNLRVVYVGPYFMSGQSILTTKDIADKIHGLADINKPDFTVAVPKGTTTERIAKMILPKATLVVVESTGETLDLLREKKVMALMADYPFTSVESMRHRNKDFVANPPFSIEPVGIAIRQGDPLLTNFLQNTLLLLKGEGLLDKMTERWFNDPAWIDDLP